jgi:DNA helicase-2/ATP-dependent DNA helicase PcrA
MSRAAAIATAVAVKARRGIPADDGALRIGQRVSHGKFGEGVAAPEGHGERARVQNFARDGAKWLMSVMKLQPLD